MLRDIEKIIQDGVSAPSGENCQPWKFEVRDNVLAVFNVPEADMSLYNSQQKGSYMSHGALIENITISADVYGYETTCSLFPDMNNEAHVANIVFITAQQKENVLYQTLYTRCTNRKDFNGKKLSEDIKKELMNSVFSPENNQFIITDNDALLPLLGQALAVNERVLFENKYIHDFFYEHIIWDKKDEHKSGGFFIDTLEFLPHQLKAVKLFRSWIVLTVLNKILGVSKMISKENGQKYAESGTFGAITMKGTSLTDYVEAGRTMQRVWLTATKLGVSMHPCNGTIYFMERILDNGGAEFSNAHKKLIKKSYTDIVESFNVHDAKISFIFRMGYAEKPTAQAKRLKPLISFGK